MNLVSHFIKNQILLLLFFIGGVAHAQTLKIDEQPARPGEWGFRPAAGEKSAVNPPGFSWRPQRDAVSYELEISNDASFGHVQYRAKEIGFNVHCPPQLLPPGQWHWRFRYRDKKDRVSAWSRARSFSLPANAREFPMPSRKGLFTHIPPEHPRLFVRPEWLPKLKTIAADQGKEHTRLLVEKCESIMKKPPSTQEPPLYPKGIERGSDDWREIWWGNRNYTIKVLNGAATLGFTRLITGREEFGRKARELLMEAAKWDPKGSTGYRYNDEAGMPYAYYFSRTYTFINDLLSEEEKAVCREVMTVRGEEMYKHLCPRHLWKPYSSHSNRAWHFLGEVAVAFFDEIPESRDWLWFSMNVLYCVYPVWCDDDGGWHEGNAYWSSYIGRFTWWADIVRVAMKINVYRKPYFSRIGYYPLYLMPPGTKGGGFGDLTARRTSHSNRNLMYIFAAASRNPHWQWYAEQHGSNGLEASYVDFMRGIRPEVESRSPEKLPPSRCFRGVGQAALNTDLTDAKNNVEIIFKSSPFGSHSHGYEAQNAFLLYAFGERLLIRTGRRDQYGSRHHRDWMWETKSVNSITVNGKGQMKRSSNALGKITGFHTSKHIDYVAGEAGEAYGPLLDRFTRHILFLKPGLVIVYDQLRAPEASTFEWRLHAPTPIDVKNPQDIRIRNGKAGCRVAFLDPAKPDISLTDKFDVPPRPRIKLKEWHLTAVPTDRAKSQSFVTVLRPHKSGEDPAALPSCQRTSDGYVLQGSTATGPAVITLREQDSPAVHVRMYDSAGKVVEEFPGGE